ncbi:MAG TPA: hypothetical protein VEN99_05165, partial [Acidimicrobiia bacterium]|nr:hypothetical protein [Acidimicrobiia bacterium]
MTIALGSCRRFGGPALLCALLVASACGGRASEAERRAARGEFPQQEAQGNPGSQALAAAAPSEAGVASDSGTGAGAVGAATGTGAGVLTGT